MNEDSKGRRTHDEQFKDKAASQRRMTRRTTTSFGDPSRDAIWSRAGAPRLSWSSRPTSHAPPQANDRPVTRSLHQLSLWRATPGRSVRDNTLHHWHKHSTALPEIPNVLHYIRTLQALVGCGSAAILTKIRGNGDRLYYDPLRNLLVVLAYDGQPRTLFRPDRGIDYWNGL